MLLTKSAPIDHAKLIFGFIRAVKPGNVRENVIADVRASLTLTSNVYIQVTQVNIARAQAREKAGNAGGVYISLVQSPLFLIFVSSSSALNVIVYARRQAKAYRHPLPCSPPPVVSTVQASRQKVLREKQGCSNADLEGENPTATSERVPQCKLLANSVQVCGILSPEDETFLVGESWR